MLPSPCSPHSCTYSRPTPASSPCLTLKPPTSIGICKSSSGDSVNSKASSIADGVSKAFQFAAGFFQLLESLDVSKAASRSVDVSNAFQFAASFFRLLRSLDVSKVFRFAAGFFQLPASFDVSKAARRAADVYKAETTVVGMYKTKITKGGMFKVSKPFVNFVRF